MGSSGNAARGAVSFLGSTDDRTPTNQPPVFTLEAINAMIPRLNELVEVQMQRRYGIESQLKALQSIIGDLPDEIVVDPKDPQEVKDLKEEIARKIAEY